MTGVICRSAKGSQVQRGKDVGIKRNQHYAEFTARVAMTALSGTIFLHFSAAC
jgi:hypothetical protein